MQSPRTIDSGEACRARLASGINQLANVVKATLGPRGRNILFERTDQDPLVTKDGVTVAKQIVLTDPVENMAAQLVKQAASKTADLAGDGTTTATVLTQAIFNEGLRHLTAGANPTDLRTGLEAGVDFVRQHLKSQSRPTDTNEQVFHIGTISANGDEAIGQLIAEAMERVGREGVITVEQARGSETVAQYTDGMQWDQGFINHRFVNNKERNIIEYDKPRILLIGKNLQLFAELHDLLELLFIDKETEQRPLLIIAEDMGDDPVNTLLQNYRMNGWPIAVVKAPGYGERRKGMLEDISAVCGAAVISADNGYKLENVTLELFGSCDRVLITRDTTTLVGGHGGTEAIEARKLELREHLEATSSDYDQEKFTERLAKLAGGVATLYIGGSTEVEVREKMDRVDDALHATRAAVEEGVVPGGGLALLRAQEALEWVLNHETKLFGDQLLGIRILLKALESPMQTILNNADRGNEGILQAIRANDLNKAYGYDARYLDFGDLFELGIIDPLKVTRLALENAVSVASLLLTTEGTLSFTQDLNQRAGFSS